MFCPKCGTNVNDGFKFCFNCGFDFSTLVKSNVEKPNEISSQPVQANVEENSNPDFILVKDKFEDLPVELQKFDGSQSKYNELYHKYIYEDCDFGKALLLDDLCAEKYPNREFTPESSLGVNTAWMYWGEMVANNGVSNVLSQREWSDTISFAKDAGVLVAISYFYEVLGRRVYVSQQYLDKWLEDRNKLEKLVNELKSTNNSRTKERIEDQISDIEIEYCDEIDCEYIFRNFLKLYDISAITSDFTIYASKYADWVDRIYTVFLTNAIRLHRLEALNNLYPTTDQKNKFRKIVEEKILDRVRIAYGKASLVNQKADECRRLSENIIELNKKTSGEELFKKGAISLGLAFISGPLGILNGARELYNMNEADNKATELRDKLWNSFSNDFWQESSSLVIVLTDACNSIMESMEDEIAVNYLAPALNNIVATLQANNVKMAPLKEYFKN